MLFLLALTHTHTAARARTLREVYCFNAKLRRCFFFILRSQLVGTFCAIFLITAWKVKNFRCAFDLFSHRHTHTHTARRTSVPLIGCPIGITARSKSGGVGRFYNAFPWFLYILCPDFLAFVFRTPMEKLTNTRTHARTHTDTRDCGFLRATGLLLLCTLTPQQSRILIFVYFAFFMPLFCSAALSHSHREQLIIAAAAAALLLLLRSSSSLWWLFTFSLCSVVFPLFRARRFNRVLVVHLYSNCASPFSTFFPRLFCYFSTFSHIFLCFFDIRRCIGMNLSGPSFSDTRKISAIEFEIGSHAVWPEFGWDKIHCWTANRWCVGISTRYLKPGLSFLLYLNARIWYSSHFLSASY